MFEFITAMEPIDAVLIGVLWVLSIIVSTVLMWTLVIPRFLRNIILDMISEPTPKTERAVQSLARMVINTPVQSGRTVKDEDGKESPEVVPLLVYAGREVFATLNHKMNAAKGGAKAKAEAIMMEAVAQSGGDARAALPIALNAASRGDYGPLLAIISSELINRPRAPPGIGGGGNTL